VMKHSATKAINQERRVEVDLAFMGS